MTTTIKLDGHTYSAELARREDGTVQVSLYRDDVWAGDGTLRAIGTKAVAIDDCPADLGDDVYEALEREIQDGMARGFGAEVDPSC